MSIDPYKYFRVEAQELLEQLGQGALELERGQPATEVVPRLLRFAHTLKGAARVVRQPEIAELAHGIEDTLAVLREQVTAASNAQVDQLLQALDAIGAHVAGIAALPPVEAEPDRDTASGAEEPRSASESIRIDLADMDRLHRGICEIAVQTGSARRAASAAERAQQLCNQLLQRLSLEAAGPNGRRANGSRPVHPRQLAEQLRSALAELKGGLVQHLDQLERETGQAQELTERLRLLPAESLFASLERTARDAARQLGKQVQFEMRGGDVRLDAHVLGTLQGALIQVVRNAVAHGIEPPAQRQAANKPPVGRVMLEVLRRGRRVAFVCRDDGAGVDLAAVRRIAQAKGLLSTAAQSYGADALVQLLLRGGLSTSEVVSEVAGRGIGLDLVREAALRLSGRLHVRTEVGLGTAVEILAPVSVSTIDVLVVEAGGATAAIPADAVRSARRVTPDEFVRAAEADAVLCGESAVAFATLANFLGASSGREDKSQRSEVRSQAAGPLTADQAWSTVILEGAASSSAAPVAIGVDRIRGMARVMLRPLPDLAQADAMVAGLFLDSEGNPQIVLDADRLAAACATPRARGQRSEVRGQSSGPTSDFRLPVLVIDDSLTTRMLEQSILTSAGYEVDVACSGEEGLEKARRRRYGLFLVDIEMPGIDGFTFVERARADPALRDVPAMMVTSRSSPEDQRRREEVGAVGYILKGEFDQTRFLDKVAEILAGERRGLSPPSYGAPRVKHAEGPPG